MVNIGDGLYLVMLEEGIIDYETFIRECEDIPPEYATYALFMKNKGKASKRIVKEMEWRSHARLKGLID